MAVVTIEHVYKRFGDVVAVDDFSLETTDGEFVVLVGPSGCGKSTMLRMIAGLETISEGTMKFDGKEVNRLPSRDRDVAMVFQNYALYPHMDVYSNMAFSLKLREYEKADIKSRVDQAAKILGIDHLLDRKPKELSGGQRQRVALGRAIVREPQVFLMDEPLSNLDAKLRVGMRAEIAKLHRRLGVTSFYVTHDQVEALTMGHRIVVMKDGRIQQISTPVDLYDRPVNKFVAEFIGSPAMNFLQGTVDEQGTVIKGEAFSFPLINGIHSAVDSYHGKLIWVGVRPEHIVLKSVSKANGTGGALQGTVELIEPLGSDVELHVNVGGALITCQVDRDHAVRAGDQVELVADAARLYLFDRESEHSLLQPATH